MSAFWLVSCGQCRSCQDGQDNCSSPVRVEASKQHSSKQPGSYQAVVHLEEDYTGASSTVAVAHAVDPLLKQLGSEASWLLLCILRRYVFERTPVPGSISRGALQFCLNFVGEYVPSYLERIYWLDHEHQLQEMQQKDHAVSPPPVKLYLRSFLVASSIFLEDLSGVVRRLGTTPRNVMNILDGLLACLKKRQIVSVFAVGLSTEAQIRAAKVAKVKALYR